MNIRIIGVAILVLAIALGIYLGVTYGIKSNGSTSYSLKGTSEDGLATLTLINKDNVFTFEIKAITDNGISYYRYIGDGNIYGLLVPSSDFNVTLVPDNLLNTWTCVNLPVNDASFGSSSIGNTVIKNDNGFSFIFGGSIYHVVLVNGQPTNFAGYNVDVFINGDSNQIKFTSGLPEINTASITCEVSPIDLQTHKKSNRLSLIATCPMSRTIQIMSDVYACKSSMNVANVRDGDVFAICNSNLDYGAARYYVWSGSQNLNDWLANINVGTVSNSNLPGFSIHAGFSGKFDMWVGDILADVNANGCSGLTVLLGHSLGGAVARLASIYLNQKGCNVKIITDGEPAAFKSVTRPTSNYASNRYVNYASFTGKCNALAVNSVDPVPRITEAFNFFHLNGNADRSGNNEESKSELKCSWRGCSCSNSRSYKSGTASTIALLSDLGGLALHLNTKYGYYAERIYC